MPSFLRYLYSSIPGILLFVGFYFMKSGEANLWLRDFGRISFLYLTLALAVTPIISFTKKHKLTPYRRVFGVMSFLLAIIHAGVYFYMEYLYQRTFFVLAHFKEWDVLSGSVAFVVITLLGITSNNFAVRLLKRNWKRIQLCTYPLFLIVALHVAFASRFDEFYMILIGSLVLLRTYEKLYPNKS